MSTYLGHVIAVARLDFEWNQSVSLRFFLSIIVRIAKNVINNSRWQPGRSFTLSGFSF